jgi:DnaJ-domain-containing protein 1
LDFIDRLADLLRSLMKDRGDETTGRTGARGAGGPGTAGQDPGYRDPDFRAAWEELDDYMRGGSAAGGAGASGAESSDGGGRGSKGGYDSSGGPRRHRPEPPVDESLRKDFANLEVPFGSDIDTVRRSYKTLILRYHPDKFGGDPEKQRVALEITKKINESFERIKSRQ